MGYSYMPGKQDKCCAFQDYVLRNRQGILRSSRMFSYIFLSNSSYAFLLSLLLTSAQILRAVSLLFITSHTRSYVSFSLNSCNKPCQHLHSLYISLNLIKCNLQISFLSPVKFLSWVIYHKIVFRLNTTPIFWNGGYV